MNIPRTIQTIAGLLLGLGAVIAFAGEPAAAVVPAASRAAATIANTEKIPRFVITAKRLTAEQKAKMDQEEGKQTSRRFADEKDPRKGVKSNGSVG